MRILSSLVWLCFAAALPAAEVGLETLPWTDAAWFWSADGPALPQINTNLSGQGPISIGGVRFERGICGHTGFSVVYNLDRNAESFSARIGIDDERHPKDSGDEAEVPFAILVDRREVFRRVMHLGEKPVPVRIDLRGKSQLELRGEFGAKGFRLQRVAWGNPVLQTDSPEKLRAALERSRSRHEANLAAEPVYPEAPAWRGIRIEKISWETFRHAYRVENGRFTLVVVPECGGRIMEFAAVGGKSLLHRTVPPEKWGTFSADSAVKKFSSQRSAAAAREVPDRFPGGGGDPDELCGKFAVSGRLRISSPDCARFRCAGAYEHPDQYCTLRPVARNLEHHPGEECRIEAGFASFRAEGMAVKKKIARHGNDVEWIDGVDGLELRTSIRPGTPRNYFELQLWGAAPEIVAETETGDRLRITCEGDDYLAREEPPLHLFFCDRFCELESHGPTRLLYPGERISLSEQWTP